MDDTPSPEQSKPGLASRLARASVFKRLGPGLITGAADDDPSGIATYSQAGSQCGVNMLWTVILTCPMMAAIQSVSARIGRVTGHGLAANMAHHFPRPLVGFLVGLLFIANTVNIGADLAAMGASAHLVSGWSPHLFTIAFALFSLLLQIFVPYHRYVGFLKWLTLALFAYVGIVFAVRIDWSETLARSVVPHLPLNAQSLTTIVAVFGTTISPYLFFWQASEEVEDEEADPDAAPLVERPDQAPEQLARIRWDTYLGMAFSNLIAYFIILTAAETLFRAGITNIQTTAEAATALRPIAGELAFFLFAMGVVGTGLLAVPVLAGSAADAISEASGWTSGLEKKWRDAPAFYTVITLATLLGLALDYAPIDPITALFWGAVLNGVIAVPIMVATMLVASRKDEMGAFVATTSQRWLGWLATALMGAAAATMLALAL
ncbi:MAG: divalent metal cation transporter [Proteobacteria bacterium]|nr:divalent metal cation transporter [Pseudomonadota bacterium]